MALFSAKNITKTYGKAANSLTVLRNISIDLEEGEMTAILGASGSGKTTFLQILGTLERPTAGQLFFRNESLLEKKIHNLLNSVTSILDSFFNFIIFFPISPLWKML